MSSLHRPPKKPSLTSTPLSPPPTSTRPSSWPTFPRPRKKMWKKTAGTSRCSSLALSEVAELLPTKLQNQPLFAKRATTVPPNRFLYHPLHSLWCFWSPRLRFFQSLWPPRSQRRHYQRLLSNYASTLAVVLARLPLAQISLLNQRQVQMAVVPSVQEVKHRLGPPSLLVLNGRLARLRRVPSL